MQPAEMPPELWREIGGREGEPMRAVVGPGCEECAGTGYRGRAGIYEFLPVSDQIKSLILERASAGAIKEAAVQQGMRTLRDDGWRSVRNGTTTVPEVVRVTQEEV
jgi:type II secretory ATPase GspE/PulE/Tfp pilus assembly ATPase PilB-like protein